MTIEPKRARRNLNRLLSQRGFGMTEVLVGAVIITGLAATTIYYSQAIKTVLNERVQGRFNCNAHVTTVMNNIASLAGPRAITEYFVGFGTAGVPLAPSAQLTMTTARAKLVPDMWTLDSGFNPPLPIAFSASRTAVIGNASMIDGQLRVLNVLYNSTANDCNNFFTTTLLDAVAEDSMKIFDKTEKPFLFGPAGRPVTKLRLRLYDLRTNLPLPTNFCPKGIWVYPRGVSNSIPGPLTAAPGGPSVVNDPNASNVDAFEANPPQFPSEPSTFANPKVAYRAGGDTNYRNDYGIFVEIQTTYLETQTVGNSCSMTQRFAYERDLTRPPRPVVTLTIPEPPQGSPPHRVSAILQIQSVASVGVIPERGVQYVCRDVSRLVTGANRLNTVSCFSIASPGPGPQYSATNRRRAPLAASDNQVIGVVSLGAAGIDNTRRPTTWRNQDWVPCDKVTLCGRPPAAVPTVTCNGVPNEICTLQLSYNNIRSECIAKVEVAAIDVAGNLHLPNVPPAITTFFPAQIDAVVDSLGNTAADGAMTPRPLCGQYCPKDFAGPWAGGPPYANPYYADGGCCVGPFCNLGITPTTRKNASNTYISISTDPSDPDTAVP